MIKTSGKVYQVKPVWPDCKKYSLLHAVMNMDPVIHGVRPLIDELNESGNFSQFCKKVRQKFQELAIKQTST